VSKKKKQPFSSKAEYEKYINDPVIKAIRGELPSWEERQKLLAEYKAKQKGR
jgi:hypothetical protein